MQTVLSPVSTLLSGQCKVPEILAPAGGRAQFFAALNSGADAVFLGLQEFNARARAENFSVEDLKELVPLAHHYGMKVLVTTNILIKEAELPKLIRLLGELEAVGVDAIIVQDFGLARIVKEFFPNLRMHASTQMAVHNLAGVIEAWNAGFKRVVLARELTANEMKKIRAAVPEQSVEIEAFCHGSLCYSYSGLCFFSGAKDARSGNRGECAYTCRKPYKILNEPGHGFLFSMKDLNTVDDLHLLVNAGIDTLKIEGRKKDSQFVSTSVQVYRKKLNELFGHSTLRATAPAQAHALYETALTPESDAAYAFQREKTSFFLKGRYHENVIDLNNPTHKGVRVGEVNKVTGRNIRVFLEVAIERFDGLRIDSQESNFHSTPQHGARVTVAEARSKQKYRNEALQFSLRNLSVNQDRVPFATEGTWVNIEIPEDLTVPAVGDIVFKSRSASLKARTFQLESAPGEYKMRPLMEVETRFHISQDAYGHAIAAAIFIHGVQIHSISRSFNAERPKKESVLKKDLQEAFSLFGELGLMSTECSFEGDFNWFLPRSVIKDLKRRTQENLAEKIARFHQEKIELALGAVCQKRSPLKRAAHASFSVKLDKIETLDALLEYKFANIEFPLAEIIFEPKRAFLTALSGAEIAKDLISRCESASIPLRIAFPTVIRGWDEPVLKKWFEAFSKAGINRFEVGNIGAFSLIESWNVSKESLDLSSDFTLYALNSQASAFLKDKNVGQICLSLEDDVQDFEAHLAHWPSGAEPCAILFKDTPLFIAESCSLTALHNGCPTSAVCGYRTLEIENDEGERFYVAHESCKSIVYGKEAFGITQHRDQLQNLGISRFRLDFLTRPYGKAELETVLNAAIMGKKTPGTHTANFERQLL